MAMRSDRGYPDTKGQRGAVPAGYLLLNGGEPRPVIGEVVEEALSCISVNGQELATLMCSPTQLDLLAAGFLFNEGIIQQRSDIASIHVSDNDCVDLWLNFEFDMPPRRITTAGCGGGLTFDDLSGEHEALDSDFSVPAARLAALMKKLQTGAELYQRSRGIHTAVLATPDEVLLQVEDVGRHNCIDKLAGAALMNGTATRERILLSSGRISSEMLNKARRLGIPVICSRTSPTSLSIALAEAWDISIVAYLRGKRMRIYSHPERILTGA